MLQREILISIKKKTVTSAQLISLTITWNPLIKGTEGVCVLFLTTEEMFHLDLFNRDIYKEEGYYDNLNLMWASTEMTYV